MIKLNQPAIKSSLAAATLALSAFSLNAQAALTSYTSGGQDVVYSSVSDVTWTKDANLLGSMIAADSGVIGKIVAASTNNYGSVGYTVSISDFNTDGTTSWYGANAFVSYLNSIAYAGNTGWQLPTFVNGSNNGTTVGNEVAELYFDELNGIRFFPDTTTFDNEKRTYWTGTERADSTDRGFYFETTFTGFNPATHFNFFKTQKYYAWAISSGDLSKARNVSAVPVPAAAWLFGSGIVSLAGLRRRKQQA